MQFETVLDDMDEKSGKTGVKLESHFSLCKNGEDNFWFNWLESVFVMRTTVSDLKANMARLSDREDKNEERITGSREHIIRLEQKLQAIQEQLNIRDEIIIAKLSEKTDRRLSSQTIINQITSLSKETTDVI